MKLERAASYLRYASPRVVFVATNRDVAYPDAHQLCPGGGALVAALETGSGRSPDVVAGKPSPHLIQLVRSATGLNPARTCMVGDRLDTDILFGNTGGFVHANPGLEAPILVIGEIVSPLAIGGKGGDQREGGLISGNQGAAIQDEDGVGRKVERASEEMAGRKVESPTLRGFNGLQSSAHRSSTGGAPRGVCAIIEDIVRDGIGTSHQEE